MDQLYFSTRILLSRFADANVQSVRNSAADAGFSIQSDPDCIITVVFGTVRYNIINLIGQYIVRICDMF